VHTPEFGLLFRRELGLLAAELALGVGDGHAFAGTHPQKVHLETLRREVLLFLLGERGDGRGAPSERAT
jgi:hypothetical protein